MMEDDDANERSMLNSGFKDLSQNFDGRLQRVIGPATDGKQQVIDDLLDIPTELHAAGAEDSVFDATGGPRRELDA